MGWRAAAAAAAAAELAPAAAAAAGVGTLAVGAAVATPAAAGARRGAPAGCGQPLEAGAARAEAAAVLPGCCAAGAPLPPPPLPPEVVRAWRVRRAGMPQEGCAPKVSCKSGSKNDSSVVSRLSPQAPATLPPALAMPGSIMLEAAAGDARGAALAAAAVGTEPATTVTVELARSCRDPEEMWP